MSGRRSEWPLVVACCLLVALGGRPGFGQTLEVTSAWIGETNDYTDHVQFYVFCDGRLIGNPGNLGGALITSCAWTSSGGLLSYCGDGRHYQYLQANQAFLLDSANYTEPGNAPKYPCTLGNRATYKGQGRIQPCHSIFDCDEVVDTAWTSIQVAGCAGDTCVCTFPSDCEARYGDPGFGIWDCRSCHCMLTNSPLVLYLPDYLSTGGGSQSWWRRGFCGSEAPTVCLDWTNDGRVTCTAWLEPGSEIAFLVTLSDEDGLHLLEGNSVPAEPWRHFFGNVTRGPNGDLPFKHGFAALAAHCGQDPGANSEIDLTECGASLFAWNDRNSDGKIGIQELVDFKDLGIQSLGNVRTTGKSDKCGNTFSFESTAICASGRCGKWLDVLFEPR